MIQSIKFFLAGVAVFAVFLSGTPVAAGDKVQTNVRVIHASQGPHHIDEGLQDIASELESIFKYTSYKLIETKDMILAYNQKGSVSLPGNRTLQTIPVNISGKRINYQITILKSEKQIFQTQVLLKDGSSITLGGPKYKDGFLLFNISGKVQ